MISLKQLNYALAVGKTRHFKKAAELCSVSQSALSTAITELETQLGLQIFERDNKKVLLTPAGEQVLTHAMNVRNEVDALYQLAQSQRDPLSFPMTMGVIPTIGPFLLPQVLPSIRANFPDFKLSIVEEQSHVLVDMVRNGEIDTAILALPYAHDGLLSFEFWQEDFYVVMPKDHPLAQEAVISSDALRAHSLLLLKDGHCLKEHALAACQFEANEVDSSLAGTSLHTLVQMTAGHMGLTLVPGMAIDPLINNNPELCARRLAEQGPHRRIAFLTRPNYAAVKGIETLMKAFRQALQSALPTTDDE